MTNETRCESCTMTIESGPYCQHCADENGQLHPFQESFDRMLQWTQRQSPDLDEAAARAQVIGFMSDRPAWKDHPDLAAHRKK